MQATCKAKFNCFYYDGNNIIELRKFVHEHIGIFAVEYTNSQTAIIYVGESEDQVYVYPDHWLVTTMNLGFDSMLVFSQKEFQESFVTDFNP